MLGIRRREFIAALGGAAVWPISTRAQQRERMRRIGHLTTLGAADPQSLARVTAFVQALQDLGWTVGRNVQVDYRWEATDVERKRKYAAELVALAPDVILASGESNVGPLQEASRTVPIVFVGAPDPVSAGFVRSLARPGGNATGFMNFEFGMSAKWPELLKQIAPRVTRVAVLRDPTFPAGIGQLAAIQAVVPSLRMEAISIDVRDAGEIEHAIAEFAGVQSGLIVLSQGAAQVHRRSIIELATRYRLPAVYPFRFYVADGGLISYGPDQIDEYRRAAGYVDRILKGENPADLPVQAPTKYELVINLKAAKALGLDIPASVYARADEVIE